mmetsp:Transcript_89738/g.192367  ORF Transcript_89738/g.192367 Transcript_89738/m.192367 type:complete len:226 (-) Transcript_89738:292-969(-)
MPTSSRKLANSLPAATSLTADALDLNSFAIASRAAWPIGSCAPSARPPVSWSECSNEEAAAAACQAASRTVCSTFSSARAARLSAVLSNKTDSINWLNVSTASLRFPTRCCHSERAAGSAVKIPRASVTMFQSAAHFSAASVSSALPDACIRAKHLWEMAERSMSNNSFACANGTVLNAPTKSKSSRATFPDSPGSSFIPEAQGVNCTQSRMAASPAETHSSSSE